MKRLERTKILVHCEKKFLEEWVEQLQACAQFRVLEEPSNSLTMVKMRESAQHSLFYLCEVLISEARVECCGNIGIGLLQGNDFDKALQLAIIDAAYQANLPIVERLDQALEVEAKHQEKEMAKKAMSIQKTKVHFDTMDV